MTVVMGAALGVVHGITEKPIAEANEKAKTEAYKAVFPEATDITTLKDDELNYDAIEKLLDEIGFPSNRLEEFSIASDEDSIHGFILVMTNSDGYGGDIKLVVGIRMDGTVSGISFLELNETVGLGMEADTEEFKQQFVDNGIGNFTYTKTGASNVGEIDALSGATITTSAVVDAVNAALNICYLLVGGGN
ncbi:MAG: RnfABCDGE type electron transport complex subunit G [Wujia sp.]